MSDDIGGVLLLTTGLAIFAIFTRLRVMRLSRRIGRLENRPAAFTSNAIAVLKEIDATWPVATSDLRERARKVIAEADGQSS